MRMGTRGMKAECMRSKGNISGEGDWLWGVNGMR